MPALNPWRPQRCPSARQPTLPFESQSPRPQRADLIAAHLLALGMSCGRTVRLDATKLCVCVTPPVSQARVAPTDTGSEEISEKPLRLVALLTALPPLALVSSPMLRLEPNRRRAVRLRLAGWETA